MIRYFAADPASSECRPVTDELHVCRRLSASRFNDFLFVFLQRRCALPCCSPPSATSLSSTWRPTCTSSGASPPAPSPCWAESSSWPSTCLQVRSVSGLVAGCDWSSQWLMFVSCVCSGVISTFVSYVCKTATGRFGPSLGAVSTDAAVFKWSLSSQLKSFSGL